MSSLSASLSKYKSELADTASRNTNYPRPSSTAPASSTPRVATPSSFDKRSHDAAFSAQSTGSLAGGKEIMTQVVQAINYLKEKNFQVVPYEHIISYLSLPVDLQKNIPLIKRALQGHDRVQYVGKHESSTGKESFKYRPLHPVTSGDELLRYLATLDTAQGVPVKELKDGWPDCIDTINRLEAAGCLLVTRNKKDNSPRSIWRDEPRYHLDPPAKMNDQVGKIDQDFVDFWLKLKLPTNENDVRNELERAGLTPTSAVREARKIDTKKKDKKRAPRAGAKTTNSHMMGILKDYSSRKVA